MLSNPHYDGTTITLIDQYLSSLDDSSSTEQQQQQQHNPHAASIDSSRIIRPDYAEPAYARLAGIAQQRWREGFVGNESGIAVYRESGLVLTVEEAGLSYVDKARANARSLGYCVQALNGSEDIEKLLGTGGKGGKSGYANWGSGWADNGMAMEGAMALALRKIRETQRKGAVIFKKSKVQRLLFRDGAKQQQGEQGTVIGAELGDGEELRADLTIVAAGAWSGALVDLRGRAEARGQVMAYVPITEQEKDQLKDKPVFLNMSTGMFFIPPVKDAITGQWVLKIARHGYGYANPTPVSPEGTAITTSLPHTIFSPIPKEGEDACRSFLRQIIPGLGDRAFSSSRICWYTDTPSGDFLITYHPAYEGLFLATGGSGHGFKFLPVLGDKIVAAIERRLEEELARLWRWRKEEEVVLPFGGTEDGSRGGLKDMVLEEEWRKGEMVGMSKL